MSKPLAFACGVWRGDLHYVHWYAVDSVQRRVWQIDGYVFPQYPTPEEQEKDTALMRERLRPLCGEVEILGE
jgi:hypothetical protein